MTLHKNHSRSATVIAAASAKRRMGPVQKSVLKCLLERGTYPGTWKWHTTTKTINVLEALVKRGLVVTDDIPMTDMRGEPDAQQRKVRHYRPAQWMRDAMDSPTIEEAQLILQAAE